MSDSSVDVAGLLATVASVMEERSDELALAQADAVRARFGSYGLGAVPLESLLESGRRNVALMVAALRAGRPPEPEELDEARRARERTAQGVPANELHDAYRMCLRIVGESFVDAASSVDLDQRAAHEGTRLLWATADVLTAVVVTARQEVELDFARHDERQRVDFLRSLVFDVAVRPELRKRAAAFGMPSDRSYWVVRSRVGSVELREELRAMLESLTRTYGCRPLLGVVDGDVVGVVPVKPTLADARFTLGIGGPAPLESLPRAFSAASRMLDTGIAFGLTGCLELNDLSLRLAVGSEPELGAMLYTRYLAPLRAEGDFGELLEETVAAHIAASGRITSTAHRLGVHQNTVRHRLARFEELTGCRIDEFETMFEVWWAIMWSRHEALGRG
ncbi:MAG: helix-turn-helix domain-containing protein [Ilumatobacteraceae bacterium]